MENKMPTNFIKINFVIDVKEVKSLFKKILLVCLCKAYCFYNSSILKDLPTSVGSGFSMPRAF